MGILPSYPSSIILPQDSNVFREPPRPKSQQQQSYSKEYDFRTLFYDVFYSRGKVILSGPPLINLHKFLEESTIYIDGAIIEKHNLFLGELDRTQRSYISYNNNTMPKEILIENKMLTLSSKIQLDALDRFSDKNVLVAKSKNNKLEWIRDWVVFYQKNHNINSVIIYDNGSSDYSAADLQEYLGSSTSVDALVVSWNFPFGPQGGVWAGEKNIPWDSDYCEYGILEHAKYKYLAKSNLVVNADIDELLLCQNGIPILDLMKEKNAFYTLYKGVWIDTINSSPQKDLYSFKDFVFQNKDSKPTTSKWSVRPKFLNIELSQWKTHYISGFPNHIDESCRHRHFRAISTGWKFVRNAQAKLTNNHVVDRDLLKSFDKAFKYKVDEVLVKEARSISAYIIYLDHSELLRSILIENSVKRWVYKEKTLVFDVDIDGNKLAFDFSFHADFKLIKLTVLARSLESKSVLARMMEENLPDCDLVDRSAGRYELERFELVSAKALEVKIFIWLSLFLKLVSTHAAPGRSQSLPVDYQYSTGDAVNVFYWDKKSNFGDQIGPYLIEKITSRPVVNVFDDRTKAGIASVGSILNVFDRPGLKVWGTGLMWSLSKKRAEALLSCRPKQIGALRGWKTYKEVKDKLGWNPPKVLGDPALILPNFYSPTTDKAVSRGKIAVVPHYSHKPCFAKVDDYELSFIDVANDLERVVAEIASSNVCISTSLHGIIVAHAYEVPWVWLRLEDKLLHGSDFKFEDFFSVLDRSAVAVESVLANSLSADRLKMMACNAKLPANKFDHSRLLDSFTF